MNDFLDTVEGPDWLHDAINSLICGDNVTAPRPSGKSVALVVPQSLYEALAEHLGAQEHIVPLLTDNREYPIEQMICETVAGGRRVHGKAYELACCALGAPKAKHHPTALHDVAEALIRPWLTSMVKPALKSWQQMPRRIVLSTARTPRDIPPTPALPCILARFVSGSHPLHSPNAAQRPR